MVNCQLPASWPFPFPFFYSYYFAGHHKLQSFKDFQTASTAGCLFSYLQRETGDERYRTLNQTSLFFPSQWPLRVVVNISSLPIFFLCSKISSKTCCEWRILTLFLMKIFKKTSEVRVLLTNMFE